MSKVYLGKCEEYDKKKIKTILKKAFKELGGIDFVKNKKILLNPNLLAPAEPEKAVTTHPSVLEATGQIVQEHGGEVFVGDSPGMGTFKILYRKTGIEKVVRENGFKFANFKDKIQVPNKDGKIVKNFTLAKAYREVDIVFSLAKLKTHGMAYYTGAIKNLFGMVPGLLKPQFHYKFSDKELFAQMLVDLNFAIKPELAIIDGIVAMEGDGPRNGNPRNINSLLISRDFVAADSVACRLVNIDPREIIHIRKGSESNLGEMEKKRIEIVGDIFDDLKVSKFKQPPKETKVDSVVPLPGFIKKIVKKILVPKPKFDHKKCILCKECIKICPSKPKSLKIKDNKIKINRNSCIKCFCCQEMCPAGAINARRFVL
ncbi:MAG: DUF362 domain-containing protein [Candidatus Mcinerneyibacterium aminivorans]|uniref:DUF362 domain-containing protein n=1 Tax=Candidatus Mcinerneyibacterium aminivorans TaxID=2703815 RepID=A0A5D0MKH9_9BACT|nr:MAG: DUF362 domain-containing protein [Candidatus Mcinerneyibacterium aminivorans]